jgi:hypothetical protein
MREARLRPEFADIYPGLSPGQWESAVRIAEAVLANLMLQEMAQAPASMRVLPEEHFEFRGGEPAPRGGQRSRVADGS